ncbi:MAG: hypothetical protein ACRD2J_05650 [Thermoanaerobaculia bacterium]
MCRWSANDSKLSLEGKTKSLYSEAHPGADGEIQDLSDVPEPGKKGRGSGSGV